MYKKFMKRLLDIILSTVGMIVLGVIIIPISILIYIEDKGPIFYNAYRLGKDGILFKMYKFRSMKVNASDIRKKDGSTFNSNNDPRLTKIGKFIRKTSIDELPQLINVIKGDMSLIGPRPDLPEHRNLYVDNEERKLEVRPGITGYSQAYFRNSIEWKERIKNDINYIDNISFILDVKILFKTIMCVLRSDGIYVKENDKKNIEENKNFICKELEWDTNYFGVKCGRVDLVNEINNEDKVFVKNFISKCDFIVLTNARGEFSNNKFIGQETKSILVDINVQLQKKIIEKMVSNSQCKSINIENNKDKDEILVKLSEEAFENSRFLNDENISKKEANGVYVNWVRNSFNKKEKFFITYEENNNILGFILFSEENKETLLIELICVSKEHKKKGIGKSLMIELNNFAYKKSYKVIKVGTQIENVNALNFYISCGYKIKDIMYIYHLWKIG